MRPFEACPFCNGEFMFDWINDTRRCNNCGALFTWRIIREPSGVPIDLTLQLKKAEDRIAELEGKNEKAFDLIKALRMYCIQAEWDNPDTEGEFNEFDAEICKWLSEFTEREK